LWKRTQVYTRKKNGGTHIDAAVKCKFHEGGEKGKEVTGRDGGREARRRNGGRDKEAWETNGRSRISRINQGAGKGEGGQKGGAQQIRGKKDNNPGAGVRREKHRKGYEQVPPRHTKK